MSNFSPQILVDREVKACSKALSIMVYRFAPVNCNHFYSAQMISDQVGELPNGQLSTLYVDTDTLKRALANQRLRDGLIHLLPGKLSKLSIFANMALDKSKLVAAMIIQVFWSRCSTVRRSVHQT